MLFPYGSDAPVYYRPFATAGVVGLNIFMFLATNPLSSDTLLSESCRETSSYPFLMLQFDQINPIQWVTAAFMHANWIHLLGNLIFLWVFAVPIEGKIGWRRFALLHLGLCLLDGAAGQIPMYILGVDGAAVGASGVIYALMAVAVIWGPDSEIDCLFVWGLGFFRLIEIPMLALVGYFVASQLVVMCFIGFGPSSQLFHLIGFAAGIPFAIWMLRTGRVDCEGWDLFSRYTHGSSATGELWPWLPRRLLGKRSQNILETRIRRDALRNLDGKEALAHILANPDAYNPPAARK